MPDIMPPTVRETFDVNKARDDGGPIARLPTLGTRSGGVLDPQFSITGVEDYHRAIHAAMGDVGQVQSSLAEAAKALGAEPPQAMAYARLSFMPDPANYGLMQWPGMQPESLRKVARENTLPQMVIRSRVADMRRYSCLSTHAQVPGWRIILRDPSTTPSEQDRKDIREAERFIANCSREQAYKDPLERDAHHIQPFESFLCGAIDDSLTFDGWAIWTDRDNASRVRSFANLPAGLIRLSLPGKGYKGNPDIFAALVDETGTPAAAFTRDEMTWCIRNVRNDPNVIGYGWSETEMSIRIIQAFMSAIELNTATFDKNGIPNGILQLIGDFWQQEQVDALQREWVNMKRGVSKMWGLPIIAVPEDGKIEMMSFMDMKGQEIRYKDHLNLMGGVYCIITQFPIRRWGMFASGSHRDNQPAQDMSTEIQGVDDPGLPAHLIFIEHRINEYILWPNWSHLQFRFEAKNPKEDARRYNERTKTRTWGEARAENDLPKLETLVEEELKPLARIMSLVPEDPALVGAFQSLAPTMLEKMLGLSESAVDADQPGAPNPGLKDPAQSQAHGHRVGVPRSAAKERQRAKTNEATSA